MTRRQPAIAVVLMLGAGHVLAQMPAPRPAAMRVDVMVQDARGNPVDGLTQEDFSVVSDGESRPVVSFSGRGGSALTAAVLIDVTASLHPIIGGVAGLPSTAASTNVTRTSSLAVVHPTGLIPSAVDPFPFKGPQKSDRVSVGAITRHLELHGPFAGNAPALSTAWRGLFEMAPIEWMGPSPIWDYVTDAARQLEGPGALAVILMTDGEASGNVHGRDEAAALAALAGVSVNVIAETRVMPHGLLPILVTLGIDPATGLRELAERTGGVYLREQGSYLGPYRERSAAIARVFDHLHHSYVLGFLPSAPNGRPHRLEVHARNPQLTVRARQLY